MSFWRAFQAEVSKQRHDAFKGRAVFFSLFVWPVLSFMVSYYSMKPYRTGAKSALNTYIPGGHIVLFLVSGFLIFELFWTTVQSAWTFSRERLQGTLEMVFLTPSSKLAFLVGRACYGLFSGVWMFFVFFVLVALFAANLHDVLWGYLTVAILVTMASALTWGTFLSSISLVSRDSGYVYYVFQEPMNLFGGVTVPPTVFPVWAKVLSLFFPVTYSLYLFRGALQGTITSYWWYATLVLSVLSVLLIFAAVWVIRRAEHRARLQGSWVLF